MIAIDIETLGKLDETPLPPITCICIYNGLTQKKHSLRFWKVSPHEATENLKIVTDELDNADYIAGFNVVLFDLEYMRLTFQIPNPQMTSWVTKCIDPFMCCKYILKITCPLKEMLANNKLASKTGCGGDAIILAKDGKWEELLDYCMMDTTLTYELCTLDWIVFSPMLKGRWDKQSYKWIFQLHASAHPKPTPKLNMCTQLPQIEIGDFTSPESHFSD
jgi:hypothetical protein